MERTVATSMRTYRLAAPSRLEPLDVPSPVASQLRDEEVLLRVAAGGICGSDLPYFAGRRSALSPDDLPHSARRAGHPLHEVAGEVLASTSRELAAGDLVVGWAGDLSGLAETIRADAAGLSTRPAQWHPTRAVMLQPLACAIHALDQVGDVRGRRVAVLGLGPIGLLLAHVAATRGASWVIGVDRVSRQAVASAFGLDQAIHSSIDEWAHSLGNEDRPDVVLEAVGHQVGTLVDAVRAVAPHGTVYYFGIPDDAVYPVPMLSVLRKNLTLKAGTVTRPFRRRALERAVSYLQQHPGLVDAYVTDVVDFAEAQQAYERASAPRTGQHKVVIDLGTLTPHARSTS